MKIHEYNEMMAYLTRPAMAYGGRIGFNEAGLVETAKNKFVELESGSTVDLSDLLDELGVEGKYPRTRVSMRIKRLLAKEFPELKLLGAVEKLQAQETKLINFLQDRINKGETRFEGGLEEIKKLANVELKVTQLSKVMRANFPKTFIYRGIDMDQLPDALVDEIIELGKIENSATITKQLKNKLPFQAGKKMETTLVNNILDRAVDEGLLEKKFERRGGSALSVTETTRRDNLIKDFIDRNPDMDNAHAIAKGVNAENPDLNMSGKFVKDSTKRLGLEEIIKTRHAKIFPEVKALDKIIKQNMDLINSDMSPEAMKNELIKAYAKETNKSLVQAESELVTRMRKLGKLYAGTEQRYEKKLYNQIKIPKNYIGSKFQQTFIAVTDRAGKVSNINMAELLGLPKSEIKLIQGTANMMNVFDFKVAGDHTDIKAMMKDFPNYRKNFTRIEYIKDSLNEFKRSYDTQINKYRKKAQGTLDPVLQQKYLEQAEALAAEFRNKTGYRIGTFGLDFSKSNTGLGRVIINPQTLRLPDLKNPYNKTLQTAMKNFETTGLPTDKKVIKFTGVDKELMESNATDRKEIFNRIQGTEEAKNSKYLKALQKVPKIGKIATAVIGGTAGAAAISTLANANEPGQMPQGSPGQLSEEEGLSLGEKAAIGAGAGGAYALKKPIWQGTKWIGKKALQALGSVPASLYFFQDTVRNSLKEGKSLADAIVDAEAGIELLYPEIAKKAGFGMKVLNPIAKRMMPVGVGLTTAGLLKDRAINMAEQAETMSALEPNEEQQRLIEEYAAKNYRGYNQGGRVGFDEGSKPKNPSRRAFLKGITALAALPLVGRFFKLTDVAKQASGYTGPAIEKIKGMPEWFPQLVKKLFNEGEDVTKQMAFKDRQIVKRGTLEGGDDVDMIYDLDTGDVSIEVVPKKGEFSTKSGAYEKSYGLDYRKGQADEMTGGTPADEFGAVEARPFQVGRDDVDLDYDMVDIDDAMSDLQELENFAKKKKWIKD